MFAAERMRILWLIAGALSVAINRAATAVDPMPLDGLKRPLTGYIAPTLFAHRVTPETRAFLDPGCASLRCTPGKIAYGMRREMRCQTFGAMRNPLDGIESAEDGGGESGWSDSAREFCTASPAG